MIEPHGGVLVNRVLAGAERARVEDMLRAGGMPVLDLDVERAKEAENIATGLYSPLTGFLGNAELESVLERGRLPNDVPWTLPIVLDVDEAALAGSGNGDRAIRAGAEVALRLDGTPFAILRVEEVYTYDKERFAQRLFGTADASHPGVRKVGEMGPYLVGGSIDLVAETPTPFAQYKLKPAETRALFAEKGWETVVAFQTRNAPHIGHEYVQKTALTFVDGILINPVLGRKKSGDFTDEAIIDSYQALIDNYFPRENAALTIIEYEMRYAGPREAVHHAIMRQNMGCTHFIVGRDHAGVGSYYGPYEAHEYLRDQFPDLGITILPFREFFHCNRCGTITNSRVCPHDEDRVNFSGTKVRGFFQTGEGDLSDLMRPEVIEAIRRHQNPFVP